jgi:hypothetical protein
MQFSDQIISGFLYRALRLGVFVDWFDDIISNHISIECDTFCLELQLEFSDGAELASKDKILTEELFYLLGPIDGVLDTTCMKMAKDRLLKQICNGGTRIDFLDLVGEDGGDFTAARAFQCMRYSVVVLEKDTEYFCAGKQDSPLGRFFSPDRPETLIDALSTVIIDTADPAGASLHSSYFHPPVDAVRAVLVPRGTVVYEGVAASVQDYAPADALTQRVQTRPIPLAPQSSTIAPPRPSPTYASHPPSRPSAPSAIVNVPFPLPFFPKNCCRNRLESG